MISLIILAAGKSTRMRGRNKLLAKVEGKPIIRRVVEAALRSKVDEVIVVLGWEADRIQKALAELPFRLVLNKDYEKGQSSSVKAGFREIAEVAQAVLILPGDVALIDPRSINLVISEYVRKKKAIVIAGYKGRPGHPILLDRKLFKEIEKIGEDTFGLKAVVRNHEREVRLIETGSRNVLRDVDTREDLKELGA
jgi:molybdenum cofactor cytidylyltransferase